MNFMNCRLFAEPINNGGKTGKYTWTQTLQDVSVSIPIPSNIKAKHLDISIKPEKLLVNIKGESQPIVDGDFCNRVKAEDCTWTIGTLALCVL